MSAPLLLPPGTELTVYVPAGEGERLDRDAFARLVGKPYAVTVPIPAGGLIARGTVATVKVIPDEGATLTVRIIDTVRITERDGDEAGE